MQTLHVKRPLCPVISLSCLKAIQSPKGKKRVVAHLVIKTKKTVYFSPYQRYANKSPLLIKGFHLDMKQIVVSLSKIIMQGRRSENRVGYKQYVDLVEMEKWMKQDQ